MSEGATGRGRPRSERARRATLAAAYRLLLRDGFAKCTVDGIASAAGVSKATIYRWWPRKSALILDTVIDRHASVITFEYTGDVRADIEKEIRGVITFFSQERAGKATLEMVAASSLDADLAVDLVDRLIEPTSVDARARLQRGIEDGELPADTDTDLLVHLLWGAVYHCFLVAHRPVQPDFARTVIDAVLPLPEAPKRRAPVSSAARKKTARAS